ncbi:hypothetical protein OF83DRAFT_840278 [Amylostereum chailletii]|nr:hypothetical protein OF83DRAFT_840278 [Amylostereum chailletii]
MRRTLPPPQLPQVLAELFLGLLTWMVYLYASLNPECRYTVLKKRVCCVVAVYNRYRDLLKTYFIIFWDDGKRASTAWRRTKSWETPGWPDRALVGTGLPD